jgi:hypothetical protein
MQIELSPESHYQYLRQAEFQGATISFGVPVKDIDRTLSTWQSVSVPDNIADPEGFVENLMKSNLFAGSWIDDGKSIIFMVRSADDFMSIDEPRLLDEHTFSKLFAKTPAVMRSGAQLFSGVLIDGVLLQLPGMNGSPSWHMWKFLKSAGWTKALAVNFIKTVTESDDPVSFATKSVQVPFKVTLPISHAWSVEKSKGNRDHWLTIEASGPEEDRDETRMSASCVGKMVKYVERGWDGGPVPYLDGHYRDLLAANLGECHNPRLTDKSHLAVDVKLDMRNPSSAILYEDVTKGKKHGASIAGIVWATSAEEDAKKGITRTVFEDVEIAEISRTSYPSWTPSFTALLQKSVGKSLRMSEVLVARSRIFGEDTYGLSRLSKSVAESERFAYAVMDGSGTFDPSRSLYRHHDADGNVLREELLKAHAEASDSDLEGAVLERVMAHLNGHFIDLGIGVPTEEIAMSDSKPENTEEVLGLEEATESVEEPTDEALEKAGKKKAAVVTTDEDEEVIDEEEDEEEDETPTKEEKATDTDVADFLIELSDRLAKDEEIDVGAEVEALAALVVALKDAGLKQVTVTDAIRSKMEYAENKLTKSTVNDLEAAFDELSSMFGAVMSTLNRSTDDDITNVITRTVTNQLEAQRSSLATDFETKIEELTTAFEGQLTELRGQLVEKNQETQALAQALVDTEEPAPRGNVGVAMKDTVAVARSALWDRMYGNK